MAATPEYVNTYAAAPAASHSWFRTTTVTASNMKHMYSGVRSARWEPAIYSCHTQVFNVIAVRLRIDSDWIHV